jgi:N6-L-threonylcarbamoyladenine synthase
MKILGIETSCDETGVAIVENGTRILSNALATSQSLHIQTGGIIPENAAREQVKVIIPTLQQALAMSRCDLDDIDAIAVTHGPGLIGSLLVGLETARVLSFGLGKPLIPTNHLYGHIYAAYLENPKPPQFPFITLVVSGGHTDIVLLKDHGKIDYLGGTRDDAAGEAFDKTARLLGLPYPGGPSISQKAQVSQGRTLKLPRPMINSGDFDMSFSGLKTAVLDKVKDKVLTESEVSDFAFAIQEAIVDLLVTKTISAAQKHSIKTIVLGGGVSANQTLREVMKQRFSGQVVAPAPQFSTDNGAMIASAAFFNYQKVPWPKVQADVSLHY